MSYQVTKDGITINGTPGYVIGSNSAGKRGLMLPGKPNSWIPMPSAKVSAGRKDPFAPAKTSNAVPEFTSPSLQPEKPKTIFETMYQSGSKYGDPVSNTANMINPKTGKPYKDSPGKASSEENALIYNSETGKYEPQTKEDPAPEPSTDDENATSRDVVRNGEKGTQTSPSPASFDQVAARIQAANPGVRFNQDYQFNNENTGSESNSLPNTPGYDPNKTQSIKLEGTPQSGKTVYSNKGGYGQYGSANESIGLTGEAANPSVYGVDYFTGAPIAQGAQRGDNPAADAGNAKTQIEGRLGEALLINGNNGVKAYDASKYKGDVNDPTMQNLLSQAKGRDRRGEAFLDGSSDSMIALRGAELAQGYITAGSNQKFARGKDGQMVELSGDAVAALKADPNAVASQQFLEQYMKKPATPADQQSADSEQPVPASTVTPEQAANITLQGTPFFETDATKIDGIGDYSGNPTGTDVDIRSPLTQNYSAREDVSEPAHNWQPSEFDVEESVYSAREPYMRF